MESGAINISDRRQRVAWIDLVTREVATVIGEAHLLTCEVPYPLANCIVPK
jgi:hypothetical protein